MRTSICSGSAAGRVPATMALAALCSVSAGALAQHPDRQGKEVVDAVCAACHATGKDKAPRIGDSKAWSARASQGLTALTEHAVKGIRQMPPHGGNAGVSDVEIARAVTYMVNRSGGHWVEPASTSLAITRSPSGIVQSQCAKCHQAGQDGAPKIGDRVAWAPHMAKGLDILVASAIHGHGAMPARGGLADLTDSEIRSAIVYMFGYGLPATPPPVAAAPPDPRHKLVAGTDIYLGMMPAESIRATPTLADVPSGKGYYHVNISLADNKSQQPVSDAQVQVRVSDGMSAQSKPLAVVAVNHSVSYGNFFRFESGNAYNITAEIRRPGVPGAIEAKFEFRAP